MHSFVYAAVEARLIFQELYLKSTFIKAASLIDSFADKEFIRSGDLFEFGQMQHVAGMLCHQHLFKYFW